MHKFVLIEGCTTAYQPNCQAAVFRALVCLEVQAVFATFVLWSFCVLNSF
jgi:hypothetical protein